MKFSIKDFFTKCDQIHSVDLVHLLKKFLTENFLFCAVVAFPLKWGATQLSSGKKSVLAQFWIWGKFKLYGNCP